MAVTKYESYYNKINELLSTIRSDNEYRNDSLAFTHWYLKNQWGMSEQQIAESIIDGEDDMGIDAVIIDNDNHIMRIFQFKFPANAKNIDKEIDQGSILKTWNGFKILISNDIPYNGKNDKFREFKEQLKDQIITSFEIYFVSYNKGIIANQEYIESLANNYYLSTGSKVEIIYHNVEDIINIYEKLNRKNNIKIALKYKQMQPAYNVQSRSINSFVGFVNGIDLVKAISPCITTIFDENIRLYESGSVVNTGINNTATSNQNADMFYFYNNGAVFICDKASNSPASSEISLEGASVVNGCQTLSVLYNAFKNDKLKESVYILIRVIEISNYSERSQITEFLNSQTPIKSSYFIANNTIVRDIQKQLLEKGYFLERQANEYQYLTSHGKVYNNVKEVLKLDDVIQYYVGYWYDSLAVTAKREKAALFEKNRIDEILSSITVDKILESNNVYKRISQILTLYRKMRRNPLKTDSAEFLEIDDNWLNMHLDEFRFMNTGDILLLNTFANLKRKYKKNHIDFKDNDEIIKDAIYIVRNVLLNNNDTPSSLTKNSKTFIDVKKEIDKLNSKVNRNWNTGVINTVE